MERLVISRAAAATLILVLVPPALAQQWKEIPSTYTNSQGFQITGFTARVAGSGCVGSQSYVKIGDPSNKGFSARRWTKATKQDGGIVCSGGTWYYGGAKASSGGPKADQPGGKEPDVLIKDGKFYRRG